MKSLKVVSVFLVICLLAAALVVSHYHSECERFGFDWSVPNVHGVMCYINNPALRNRYMFLRDLLEREKKPPVDQRMHPTEERIL
jgi:hypothetical protein